MEEELHGYTNERWRLYPESSGTTTTAAPPLLAQFQLGDSQFRCRLRRQTGCRNSNIRADLTLGPEQQFALAARNLHGPYEYQIHHVEDEDEGNLNLHSLLDSVW
jgi:hypothetical protein